MLQHEPDEALAALVRQGHESAFVAIYDRHHRGLIAFCRHMLSSKEEAEDALQHTFLAAYKALTGNGRPPKTLKPWLYTIAHNRCVSVLRARRAHEPADEANDGLADPGLADVVQRRADLRDLLADLHRLPEDQKAALVLFEMGDFSHADIAETLSVTREKVKALVFQAREGLLRARTARDTPCAEIRRDLASRTRALPRRGVVRGHLDRCPACAAYDLEVRRQRAALALVLPVVPSLELKGSVLGPMLGGGATIAGGGALIAGGTGAGAGGLGIGGAGAAATAGAGTAGTAAAGAGGAASIATSAGGLAGAGAASGLGALAAKTVVAKALTVVAVATAAAGTGKVAEEVHHRVTSPAHAVTTQANTKPAPSVVTSSDDPTTTTLLPNHLTITTTTTTPAPVTATATTATTGTTSATSPTSSGGTATVPSSTSPSSSTPSSGGTSTPPASSTPAEPTVDPTTGGTTAPAVVVNADPPPASPPASDPSPPAPTDPPAAAQDPPATTDPNVVSADVAPSAGAPADSVGTNTVADPTGTVPPGCPTVPDPTATGTTNAPANAVTDPVVDTTPAGGVTAPDPGAAGANPAPESCPPITPAAGSAAEPAAGATVTASDASAIAVP
jgi:RNA polymerase sigma factor (sigma-70 family)